MVQCFREPPQPLSPSSEGLWGSQGGMDVFLVHIWCHVPWLPGYQARRCSPILKQLGVDSFSSSTLLAKLPG